MQVAEIISSVVGADVPVRVIGYDGSKAGPDSSEMALRIISPRALARLATAPGTLGLARAYVSGEIEVEGDLYALLDGHGRPHVERPRAAPSGSGSPASMLPIWLRHRQPPPAQEYRPARAAALQAARQQGDRAPLRRVQPLLRVGARAVDGLHVRGATRRPTATLEEAQAAKYELVAQKLGAESRACGCSTSGCGWGGMVMHAAAEHGVRALGVTLSRNQAEWAQAEIERRGPRRPRRGAPPRLPRRAGAAVRRDQLDRAHRAHRPGAAAGLLRGSCTSRLRPGGRLLNHCITQPRHRTARGSTRSSPATSSRTASWTRSA